MGTAKHTPGPWHRNIKPARIYPAVWAGRNTHVAAVVAGAPRGSGNGATMSDEELEANINLIVAAPELLNGCNALLGLLQLVAGRDDLPDGVRESLTIGHRIDEARAAIAKATGAP